MACRGVVAQTDLRGVTPRIELQQPCRWLSVALGPVGYDHAAQDLQSRPLGLVHADPNLTKVSTIARGDKVPSALN